MVKLRKIWALALAGCMAAGALTGCGSSGKTESKADTEQTTAGEAAKADGDSKAAEGADDKPVTITFGFWGDTEEAQMKMDLAQKYMDEHPNVTIQYEYTDGASYLTKLQTWFSSGSVPDVFGLASDQLFNFLGSEEFEDLKPYIEKDGLTDAWGKDSLEAYADESGKVYATPFLSKVFAIAYNKDLFDKAGIDYPTDDWTEEDMLSAAEKLTSGEGTDKVYGINWGVRPPEFYRNLYGDMIYDVNTYDVNIADNKQFAHAVSMFKDTIDKGWAPNATSGAVSTGGFETGQYGMQLCATWDIATFQNMIKDSFKWDIAMLPVNKEFDHRMLSTLRGNGWCMSSDSKEKEVCWDFIKFMSATEDSAIAAENYGIPALASYAESDIYLSSFGDGTPYDKGVFIRMLEYTTPFYNLGAFAEVNDVIKTQYDLLLENQTTLDEMLKECQSQAEVIMSQYK